MQRLPLSLRPAKTGVWMQNGLCTKGLVQHGLDEKRIWAGTEDKKRRSETQRLPFLIHFETFGLPRRKKRQG